MKEETHDINEIIIRYLDGSAELEEKRLFRCHSSFFHNPAGEHRRGDGGDESDCSD